MAIALVTNTVFGGAQNGGTTSTGKDTTGANLILVFVGSYQGGGSGTLNSVTDNKGNSYTRRLVLTTSPTQYQIALWECKNPIVGSGHTWTQTGSSTFNSFEVQAFSGVDTTAGLGGSSTATISTSQTTAQGGSVTPSANGALVVSGLLLNDNMAGTVSIGSSLTITDQQGHTANTEGSASAYLVQNTAAAINPQWSGFSTGSLEAAALNAWYSAASGSGTAYTVAAAQGLFGETGKAAALVFGRRVISVQGSFSESGQTAILKCGRRLAGAQGSFVKTGFAATLGLLKLLAAACASFALAGKTVVFKSAGRIPVAPASMMWTGYAAKFVGAGQIWTPVMPAAEGWDPVTPDGEVWTSRLPGSTTWTLR